MSHETLILRFREVDVLSEHKKQGKVSCKNKTHFHLPIQDIDMKTESLESLLLEEILHGRRQVGAIFLILKTLSKKMKLLQKHKVMASSLL
jgi:hypothetical protein